MQCNPAGNRQTLKGYNLTEKKPGNIKSVCGSGRGFSFAVISNCDLPGLDLQIMFSAHARNYEELEKKSFMFFRVLYSATLINV